MYFINICQNPDILRVIYLITKIFNLVFIVVPIILIVMITIDLFKTVIGNEKAEKENKKTIINRLIFAILLFFVPTIVSVIMNLLSSSGINSEYQDCINNANKETINALEIQQEMTENNN